MNYCTVAEHIWKIVDSEHHCTVAVQSRIYWVIVNSEHVLIVFAETPGANYALSQFFHQDDDGDDDHHEDHHGDHHDDHEDDHVDHKIDNEG